MTTLRIVLAVALASMLAACSSQQSTAAAPADGGGGSDGLVADSTSSADSGGGSDAVVAIDSGDAWTPADAAATDSGGGGDASITDAEEEGCIRTDGAPYVALSWNEGCSQTVTSFTVEWGPNDSGTYPYSVDAGDPCDAAGCAEGGPNAQLFCQYDLPGLEAGTWCFVTEACDNDACSSPSGQACADIPRECP
jgi:hypothetical protein